MSSYLTFYLKPKKEDKDIISLISYSRNTQIYKMFMDGINPTYIGIGDETLYTELTKDKINTVIEEIDYNIKNVKRLIETYEKCLTSDNVEYIIELKEHLEDLETALNRTNFIKELVYEADLGCANYSKILCNVD